MENTIKKLNKYFAEIAENEARKYFEQEAEKKEDDGLTEAIPELLKVLNDLRPLRDNNRKTQEYLRNWLNKKKEPIEVYDAIAGNRVYSFNKKKEPIEVYEVITGNRVYSFNDDFFDLRQHDMFANWLFEYFQYLYKNKTEATIDYAYALRYLTQLYNRQILDNRTVGEECELPNYNYDDVCAAIEAEAPIASNDWDFYYDTKNIENQQFLVDTIQYFENGKGKDIFEPLNFLNLLWAQHNFINRNISKPKTVVDILKELPVTDKERHVLFCFLIYWAGGYPISNMNAQWETTYGLIVNEFLKYPKDTPEKEFCKKKWYADTSKIHGDLIHSEKYERAQMEVLEKEVEQQKSNIEDLQRQLAEANNKRTLATQQEEDMENNEQKNNQRTIKVLTVTLMEILKKAGISKATTDLTKIVRLISYLIGRNESKIYNDANNHISLTKYHQKEIDIVNKLLSDVNIGISITINNEY